MCVRPQASAVPAVARRSRPRLLAGLASAVGVPSGEGLGGCPAPSSAARATCRPAARLVRILLLLPAAAAACTYAADWRASGAARTPRRAHTRSFSAARGTPRGVCFPPAGRARRSASRCARAKMAPLGGVGHRPLPGAVAPIVGLGGRDAVVWVARRALGGAGWGGARAAARTGELGAFARFCAVCTHLSLRSAADDPAFAAQGGALALAKYVHCSGGAGGGVCGAQARRCAAPRHEARFLSCGAPRLRCVRTPGAGVRGCGGIGWSYTELVDVMRPRWSRPCAPREGRERIAALACRGLGRAVVSERALCAVQWRSGARMYVATRSIPMSRRPDPACCTRSA